MVGRYVREPLHIVLDSDGVLADFAGGMLPHLSAALGREIREEHLTEYYFERALGIPPDLWATLWGQHEDRLYAEAAPYPGVAEGLTALGALGRLTIQTGRPEKARPATREWIARHLGQPIDVHFRSQMGKYRVEDRVDYFIEDNLNDVLNAEVGRAVLIDRPWNRRGAPERVPRVKTLLDAARVIEAEVRGEQVISRL